MPAPKKKSPSARPVDKVQNAGLAGSASVLVVFVAGQLGLEVPPEVASAVTVLVGGVAGYFTAPR